MTNETKAVAARPIDNVRAVFDKMKPQFAMVLPRHITPDRMVRVALTAIQNTPKLLDCDKTSLYSAVMRAAQLGLEPDGILGQAYLIPYGKQVQFIPGYKGLIDLARRSGEVSNIIAKEVCKNDEFTVDFSLEVPFVHKPKLNGERGEVTHFWALARFKDGGFHWDYLTADEVVAIRDQSSGWQSAKKFGKQKESPWEKHFVEMGKKTAIRRIAKFLPMSVQKAAMVEELVDAGKKFTTDDFGDIVIDGEAGELIENADDSQERAASKLDQFAGTPHDPATGEVIDGGKAELPVKEEPEPRKEGKPGPDDHDPMPSAKADKTMEKATSVPQIKMAFAPGTTTNDWEGWTKIWSETVFEAESGKWLETLKARHAQLLSNLQKLKPELYAAAMEKYDAAMAMFAAGQV